MPRATYQDLYNALSYQVWKTGIELRNELEQQGLKAGHMRGIMYVHLSQWEEQELVSSRKRPLTPEQIGMCMKLSPLTEYLRISTGMPRRIFETEEGLEGNLQPALA